MVPITINTVVLAVPGKVLFIRNKQLMAASPGGSPQGRSAGVVII